MVNIAFLYNRNGTNGYKQLQRRKLNTYGSAAEQAYYRMKRSSTQQQHAIRTFAGYVEAEKVELTRKGEVGKPTMMIRTQNSSK